MVRGTAAPTFGTSARAGHPVLMLKPLPHELVAQVPNMPNHPGLNDYFDGARAALQERAEREERQERELAAARRRHEEALAQQQPPRLPPLARVPKPASPPPPRREMEKMRYPWEHGYVVVPAVPTPRPQPIPQPPPQPAAHDLQQRYLYPSPRDNLRCSRCLRPHALTPPLTHPSARRRCPQPPRPSCLRRQCLCSPPHTAPTRSLLQTWRHIQLNIHSDIVSARQANAAWVPPPLAGGATEASKVGMEAGVRLAQMLNGGDRVHARRSHLAGHATPRPSQQMCFR